jgi:D-sedoheptulose 7-phosphate isomerase
LIHNEKSTKFAVNYIKESILILNELDLEMISKVSEILYESKEKGKNIFFFGNGGSHSIASHIAGDLGKGTKIIGKKNQKFYKTFALDNPAWLTAQANDGKEPFLEGSYPGIFLHGYDGIFVGQMENFFQKGDIAFGISSSGNSPNVINALLYAKQNDGITISMTGFDGGGAKKISDYSIHIECEKGNYGLVEGIHEVIHHYLYENARRLEIEGI